MRLNRLFTSFSCFAALILLVAVAVKAPAQVHQSAVGTRPNLWVGGEFSDFSPDYNFFRLYGVGVYGDYYFTHNLALEAEGRLLDFKQAVGQTQKSILFGPSYTAYRHGKFSANGKLLLGAAKIIYPLNIGYGSYFAFAPGGNVEYQISPRIRLRGEYEYEFLPSAPGFPGQRSNGLTPNGFSFGASYHIF